MESWSSEGKGFLFSDELILPTDALERSRRLVTNWDLRTPCNYENNLLVPGRQAIENQGIHEMIKKSLPDNPIGEILGDKFGNGRVASSTCMVTPKAFSGEEESSSRLSSFVVDSNNRESSLIDLKLGRLADCRDANSGESSRQTSVLFPMKSSVPAKRGRTPGLNSQTSFCQVHGCDKDLSSSKDYHKRHKVCEVHSKTAKVIVNGIEQRFCQQCSRFHLLVEFDDGKRSCRKRLSGHNERRRKPQLANHSGKMGSRFLATSLSTKTSFICPDIFPNSILHPLKYETSNWSNQQIKLEDEAVYNPRSMIPITNEHLFPRFFLPPYGMGKQYHSLQGNGIDTAPGSIFYENGQYPHNLVGPNSVSQLQFINMSSGSEDLAILDTASTIQGISGVSDSGRALSLLSSQSQYLSNHSSGIPMAQPLLNQGSHAHHSVGHFPEKRLGVSSQALNSVASTKFSSSVNTLEIDHLEPVLVSDTGDAVEVNLEGILQGTDLVDAKNSFPQEHGFTVDLLRLSSQLQRVEHQKRSLQVKQENDVFCCLPIT